MKRLTTDTPKDNLEAALNLFYIKDHETWVLGGGPGPEYADVSLFDFIRDVAETHIPDVELPEDNDDLSNMMPEWLMDGIESVEGVVALLYTAAWAYAELRHKLMQYEDAEESNHLTVGAAIDKLFSHNEMIALWHDNAEDKDHSYLLWRGEAWKLPKMYENLPVIRFKGIIPESITRADTINILVDVPEPQGEES